MKRLLKISVLIAVILFNILIAVEIFIYGVTINRSGIPINILLDIKDIYNNGIISTGILLFSIVGFGGTAYVICRICCKNKTLVMYGADLLMSVELMLDAAIAMFIRYFVGGYNLQSIKQISSFATIGVMFTFVFLIYDLVFLGNKTGVD